jgi:thiol-disulfide isomerase/thioredoxin
MQIPKRRLALNLFRAAVFFGLAGILGLTCACLARAETPVASGDIPSSSPVLLAFHAEWCGPCRAMEPAVDAVARDGYNVQRIDIDRNRELAARYSVGSIPCFIVVERGKEIDRIVGHASVERLKLKLTKKSPVRNQPSSLPASPTGSSERRPHPAWRYEKAVGYRAAVVRIFCRDDLRTRSIGSGTLVRWAKKRVVVLTARHVVQDAKSIVVELFNKKTYTARVLKLDAVWDCAVLDVIGTPEGVEPAELELGDAAMQHDGDRIESCGYGPDGKLACNTGLFLGYKRSNNAPNGPADWFEISGHARQGDSGGGMFNDRGRLVGVLWGTNGEVVVGVQAGRLHVLLDSAVGQESVPCDALPISSSPGLQVSPSPRLVALPGPEPYVEMSAEKKPILPWRGAAQQRDEDLNARTGALLQAIEAERRARLVEQKTPAVKPEKAETPNSEPSPLLAGLCVLAAVAVGFIVYFSTKK